MSTVTLACPRCSQAHCIDLGASGDFSIDRQGQLATCPSCKHEFRVQTAPTRTVHEQLDASADFLFHAAFHADPAAEAVAQAEYRRQAHTGEAIVNDPRD